MDSDSLTVLQRKDPSLEINATVNRRSFLKLGGAGVCAGAFSQTSGGDPAPASANSEKWYFDISSFGAVGDGATDATESINAAIAAASEKGGIVFFPGGVYRAFTIHLRSNVTLQLSPGCTVQAAEPSGSKGSAFDLPESTLQLATAKAM